MATVNGLHVPDETLLADGFEGALLGFCEQMNMPVQAVYSYVGPETPVFVHAYME